MSHFSAGGVYGLDQIVDVVSKNTRSVWRLFVDTPSKRSYLNVTVPPGWEV